MALTSCVAGVGGIDLVHVLDAAEEDDMLTLIPHHVLFHAYDDVSHSIQRVSVVYLEAWQKASQKALLYYKIQVPQYNCTIAYVLIKAISSQVLGETI